MTTHVTIGANANPDYQFLVPFSALLWRDRIGFNPIVMKVGDWVDLSLGNVSAKRGSAALAAMTAQGITFIHVDPMRGLETGRTAQQCRELVGCLDLPEDDWAMPSDADLWPIRKEYYQQHQAKPGRVTSYYANGDHYQTLPTCHVTAQVSKWREMYGVKAGDDITAACRRNFDDWLPKRRWQIWDHNFALWMADQAIVSEKVMALPEGYEKVERFGHPAADRLDRGAWPASYDIAKFVDAHLLRRPDEPNVWPRVLELFSKLLPQHVDWAKWYHEAYTEVI